MFASTAVELIEWSEFFCDFLTNSKSLQKVWKWFPENRKAFHFKSTQAQRKNSMRSDHYRKRRSLFPKKKIQSFFQTSPPNVACFSVFLLFSFFSQSLWIVSDWCLGRSFLFSRSFSIVITPGSDLNPSLRSLLFAPSPYRRTRRKTACHPFHHWPVSDR